MRQPKKEPSTTVASPVPRLDLAPKRKRPLFLWNPLDYLTLLYWAFSFPQAIRWYVETFGNPKYQKKPGRDVWGRLRDDPVQRNLVLQMFVILLFFLPLTAWGLENLGVPIDWFGVTVGVALGMTLGVTLGVVFSVADSLSVGVAVGVTGGVAFGMMSGVAFGMMSGAAVGVASGVVVSVVVGVVVGAAFNVAVGVTFGVMHSVILGSTLGLVFGMMFGVAGGVIGGMVGGRLPEWLLAWSLWRLRQTPVPGTQMAWLPLPGYQHQIEKWLEQDWHAGVYNINQLLTYTLQFIPVIGAINAVLARLPEESLLPYISVLTESSSNWDLVWYGSVNLHNALWQKFTKGLFVFPDSPAKSRRDTYARAVCSGFWYWHKNEAANAAIAFAFAKDIPYGLEIFGIAQAIDSGQKVATLQDLISWDGVNLTVTQSRELRPGALQALRILREVTAEVRTAHHALAPFDRFTALSRANAVLTNLQETGASVCPEPEWSLIAEIACKWRNIPNLNLTKIVVRERILRRPGYNPYTGYSGLPVTGFTFVGRANILRQIERHLTVPDASPPLILYGHRRMGKSSILRNLYKHLPTSTLFVYLDMQSSAILINHTGELLLDIAEAIYKIVENRESRIGDGKTALFPSSRLPVSVPNPADYVTLGSARRALNALLEQLAPQVVDHRLVLAIDEFEVIQDGIDKGRIEPEVLSYLRSRIQEYTWLALVFAGLHTLDEIGRDYMSVFYGQAEHIRVSYLNEDDVTELIVRPHPDFVLEYTPELRAELYRLTYGQPYLLQRLCWELVERWNERFLKQGESTPRTLMLDELPNILTPDFYHAAGYYFDGVWGNTIDEERAVLRAMATHDAPWTRDELSAVLPAINLDAVFALLKRHDVVLEDATGVRFASELLRRWIAQFSTD